MIGYWFIHKYQGAHSCSIYLSEHIYYQPPTSYRLGYTYDNQTHKKLLTGLDWVIISPEDSLAVFCQGRNRGYLNTRTGQVAIPAIYHKAWIFSNGVASVMKNDSLYFIGHDGKRIINQGFDVPYDKGDCVFNNGFCRVKRNGKYGVIDKIGKIRIPIEFDYVRHCDKDYWAVCQNNRWGVVNDSNKLVVPCIYRMVDISGDNGIYLTDTLNYCKRYSFTGELLDNFVIDEVTELIYDSQVIDTEGTIVYKTANCLKYKVPRCLYGLMSNDGRPLTAPVFLSIEAINENLYLCHYENEYNNDGEGILMNSKGEIIRL
jgi:hypothetical protein